MKKFWKKCVILAITLAVLVNAMCPVAMAAETTGDTVASANALTIGNNSINAEDITFTYTAEADGTLTLNLGIAIMGSVETAITVNGIAADSLYTNSQVILTLAAGDVVEIVFTAEGYATLVASWNEGGQSEATEATEPEAIEPAGETVTDVLVDGYAEAAEDTKWVYTFVPEVDGVLTVTVGDGSTEWSSDIFYWLSGSYASASGCEEGTYSCNVTAGNSYIVRVWATDGGALEDTPVKVTYTAVEEAEPEATEPEATEPEATEPEATEPEATEPEATEPEATEPEATEPEATEPEATEPEATGPDAPVVMATNIASSGKIKISWNKVEGATKYEVWYATSKNGTYKRLTTTAKLYVNHNSAVAGKTYYYYAIAVDADCNKSEKSNIVYRICDLAQPEITLSNIASSGKVQIKWEKIEGATKYEVYRATSKNGTYKRLITTKNLYLNHNSGVAGKTYYYKVRAICGVIAATSAYSSVGSRCCDLARPVVTLSRNSSGNPVIKWDAVDGATKYEVWYATSENGTYKRLITTTKTSITNTSAVAGKTYYYKVRALCDVSAAASAYSAVKSATVTAAQKQRMVARVSLGSRCKPVLCWDSVSGATRYKVYIYSESGELIKTVWVTGTKLTHSSAQRNVTYYYRVQAYSGSSAISIKSPKVFIKSK